MKLKAISLAIATSLAVAGQAPALANSEVDELKQQVQMLMDRIEQLEDKQQNTDKQMKSVASKQPTKVSTANDGSMLSFYGGVHISMDHNSETARGADKGTSLKSNASRLGFRGAMPTGWNDTELFYRAGIRYGATDDVNNEIEWRVAFAGLRGSWGAFRAGRLTTQYKSTYVKIDPWTDNAPQARQAGGMQGVSALHASYFNNAVQYNSPKFAGGASVGIWHAREFDDSDSDIHNNGVLRNFKGGHATGAGVRYENDGLYLAADVVDLNADEVSDDRLENDSGWQIAARYQFNDFSIAGMYEDVKDIGLGKNYYINAIYHLDDLRLIAAYGRNTDARFFDEDTINTWSIGAKYKLTDRSELFAAYVNRDRQNHDRLNTFTVGVNAKFGFSIR